jgi:hypothetical protein
VLPELAKDGNLKKNGKGWERLESSPETGQRLAPRAQLAASPDRSLRVN